MARELWVHGDWIVDGSWDCLGIFTKKSKAIHHCTTVQHFAAPVRLNEPIPHGTANWPGIEFPLREEIPTDASLRV